MRQLYCTGIVAWNAALLSPGEREQCISDFEANLPAEEARRAFRAMMELLIQRKLDDFADNQREIVGFDLSMGPDGPFLNVMSTIPGERPMLARVFSQLRRAISWASSFLTGRR